MLRSIVCLSILAGLLFAFQQMPIPPYEGDEEPECSHGQPDHCRNHDSATELHNCACMPTAKDGKDACRRPEDFGPHSYGENGHAKCSTSCRPKACKCRSYCTS
jgi:hypothetical protein